MESTTFSLALMLKSIMLLSYKNRAIAILCCIFTTGCVSSKLPISSLEPAKSNQTNEVNNVQSYKNVRSTFTDCEGKPAAAWVLISPDAFPKSLSGKFALIKFQVNDEAEPYDTTLVKGDDEVARASISALMRSKFPAEPSPCWLVKYEYVD